MPSPAPRSSPSSAVPTAAGIVLQPHDTAWGDDFAREAAALRDALKTVPLTLHHIGSTAIPGIVAKPVIDLLGEVQSLERIDAQVSALESIGYEALGEYGIAGRRYFRKARTDGVRTHHLHVFASGSPEVARHLDFRDYLRAFPEEARAYDALKRTLAAQCRGDTRAYTDGKTAFVQRIERAAAAWRTRTLAPSTR